MASVVVNNVGVEITHHVIVARDFVNVAMDGAVQFVTYHAGMGFMEETVVRSANVKMAGFVTASTGVIVQQDGKGKRV